MLDVHLFGEFKVSLDNQPIEIPARSMQSLLAYLILNAGTAYRREKLAGLLWPESDEKNARHNLRQTLWRLGKAIGKGYFLTDKVSVGFNPQADYRLDVAVLQDKAAEWSSTDQLVRSVSVYTDVLLPGFYDDWVLLEQERLQAIYEDRMQMLLDRLIHEGRWRETREWAESWLAQGQVPEGAYRALMVAHAGLGDQSGVNAVYQRCVEALEGEIGVEPSPETQALFQKISSGQDLPELQGKYIKPHPPVRLPLQPTPFIGRKNDLKELAALLTDPTIRLVNVLGPGGIGKTRLAIEAARAQSDAFVDGIYFVSLAPLDDPNLIATPIANAINFSFLVQDQREKVGKNHQNQQLLDYLGDKQMMLVLDNLEHLLAGLSLIADMLQFASEVKVLTTSRQRLGLRGETAYTVGNMLVPENINKEGAVIVEDYDALQLFANCAQRAQPRFDLTSDNLKDVITICQLVDGLPLGIELAAAWVGLLTPQEIAAEIKTSLDFLSSNYHDMPDRQQSIRSVFESSWGRLTEIEQEVFQRLSVFRGGFTRPEAGSITGATVQVLMALVNKSLIQPDYTGRYYIHELLRQFGSDKLQEAGETERTRDRHLEFFLNVAEESESYLWGSEQVAWLNQLELEHDNLRAALEWGLKAEGKAELGLLLAGSLEFFWSSRCLFDEGREYLSAALSRPESFDRTAARAKALHAAGHLAYVQSDYPATLPLLEESISIYKDLGPTGRRGIANALITLGDMETELGDYATASSLMKEALGIMRELNDQRGIARALWQLGQCAVRPGDFEQAVQYYEMALPLLRQLGDKSHTAIALSGLAEVALRRGDYERAYTLEEESLALRREISETWGIAISLANFAWIALRQNDLKQAVDLLAESLTLRHEIGDRGGIAWCLEKFAEIALTTGQRATALRRGEDFRRVARLFGAAEALRAPVNSTIDLVDQPEYERQVAIVQTMLDEVTFTGVWAEGQAMTLEQTIKYALAVEPTS
jgi:predicted ATPase/DNA-binding SARP family transcriptional activator/Tfp pilus assembly protein PilF